MGLVLIDSNATSDADPIHYKCGWSAFASITLHAKIAATWVNGYLRYRDGSFVDGPNGMPLQFKR